MSAFLSSKIVFLLDATLGMINIQQNDIIKIFSIAAVVFLPPTLVASIYGMNFDHMPELDWMFGYPLALVLMVLVGGAALPLFQAERLALISLAWPLWRSPHCRVARVGRYA